MKGRSLRTLSIIGLLEGLSLIVLLFIAVPLKYWMAHEQLVHVVGPIHGGIFLLYIVIAVIAVLEYQWSLGKFLIILAASVIPFGFLYVEFRMIRPQQNSLSEISSNPKAGNTKMYLWMKRIGVTGFLFFLAKGLVWVAVFAGLIKGC
jgi:integral membrane protein